MNKKTYKVANDMIPAEALHPGELIADEIEYRGIKQKDLAKTTGIASTMLNEIIHGKRNITAQIAIKLEKALDIDAEYWMRLQMRYEIDSIRIKMRKDIDKSKLTPK